MRGYYVRAFVCPGRSKNDFTLPTAAAAVSRPSLWAPVYPVSYVIQGDSK